MTNKPLGVVIPRGHKGGDQPCEPVPQGPTPFSHTVQSLAGFLGHNDANVVAVGGRQHTVKEATVLIEALLQEPFSNDATSAGSAKSP
jgi:hypothetical protein